MLETNPGSAVCRVSSSPAVQSPAQCSIFNGGHELGLVRLLMATKRADSYPRGFLGAPADPDAPAVPAVPCLTAPTQV